MSIGEIVGELHFAGDVRQGSFGHVYTDKHGVVRVAAAEYDEDADRTTVYYEKVVA